MQQFFFDNQGEGFAYAISALHPIDIILFWWEHVGRMFFTHPILAFQLHVLGSREVVHTELATETEVALRKQKTHHYRFEVDLDDEGRNSNGYISFEDRIDPRRSFRIDFSIVGTAVLSCDDFSDLPVPLPRQPAS